MKVAIVHDWLVVMAGAESVLEQMLEVFPGADVYSVVNFLDDSQKKRLKAGKFYTSFIQRLPFAKKKYRTYLPLMPLAIEQFDLSDYDLVISSSHAIAKGVITGPDQPHISYVNSPIRYAWDLQHTYLRESKMTKGFKSLIARIILHYIRLWDTRTAFGVDYFIANSRFIGRRIRKVYRRDSIHIYPPVHLETFTLREKKEDFYLTTSRFVPYKRIPMIVEAFSKMPEKKLIVIGEGPEEKAAKAAAGPNVTFLGYQPQHVVVDYMQRAKAFVFAAEEDFGIVPVEAQGCGTPVIAYGKGGACETVVEGKTGVFFYEQTVEALVKALRRFEQIQDQFDPKSIRAHALQFDVPRFCEQFKSHIEACVKDFQGR